MQRRQLPVNACVLMAALFSLMVASVRTAPQAQPATPAKPLDLVPVNVHVLDRSGKAITDLKESDFTITENGAPQQIRSFSVQTMTPGTPPADTRLPVRTRLTLAPQDHRIFVIMLGRGRLEDPTKALTGLAAFVRKLQPQDKVALFAHDRALTFTADHEKVAQALERCKKAHADVDLDIDNELGQGGMAALYGTKTLPRKLQTKIDEMVLGPGAKPPTLTPGDTFNDNAFRDLSLDDFMFTSSQTLKDDGNLRAMLEYLRRYEGEKHLIFVSEKGMDKASVVPNEENDRYMAQAANDGRVAIFMVQAGGMTQPDWGKELDTTHQQALALASLRNIAQLSGGELTTLERGATASLDRIDEITRSGYLIGYQPTNASWDASYRNIVVKVNRPDATVYYRRGYFRIPQPGGFDRRGQITVDRLSAAGTFRREVNDIKIKAKAAQGQSGSDLAVEGKIDLSKVALVTVNGKHASTLDVAVFCLDSSGWPAGSHTSTISISLTDEELAQYQKDGMPFSVHFPLDRGTNKVSFVVYDYRADLIGRVDTKIF